MDKILKILLCSIFSLNVLAQGFSSNNTVNGNFRIVGGVIDLGDFASDPSTFANGQMYYNTTTGKFRCKESGAATDCIGSGTPAGYIYSATAGDFIEIDPTYFVTGTPQTRYVNPTTGSDTLCDGKGSGASPTLPCAWASVQRALEDIPNGRTSNVLIKHSAGTVTTSQIWNLTSSPAGNVAVTVEGACDSPVAVLTTTGTGTARVVNSVTRLSQFDYVPTVASGTIPATIAEGEYRLRANSSVAATLNFPSSRAMTTSSTPGIALITTSSSAISTGTPSICSWETNFTGSLTVGANVTQPNGNAQLNIHGIRWTSTASFNNTNIAGSKSESTGINPVITNGTILNMAFNSSGSGLTTLRGTINNGTISSSSFVNTGLNILGRALISASMFKASSTPSGSIGVGILQIGSTIASSGTGIGWGNSIVDGLTTVDIESSSGVGITGIYMDNGKIHQRASGAGCATFAGVAFDIQGGTEGVTAPLYMLNDSFYEGCGTVTGKVSTSNIIQRNSKAFVAGMWSGVTNIVTAANNWKVGALATVATASLPVVDYGSGSFASDTANGPSSVPIAQGGTGTTTAFTPGSVVFAGTSGIYAQDNTNLFWDDTNNRLGIGDSTPSTLLDVGGDTSIQGNTTIGDASGDTLTSNAATWSLPNDTAVSLGGGVNGINFDSNTLSIDALNNFVGIGISLPVSPLDVTTVAETAERTLIYAYQSNTQRANIEIQNFNTASAAAHATLRISTLSGGGDPYVRYAAAGAGSWSHGVDRSDSGKFKIAPNESDVGTNTRMTIETTGNVGIGDSTPSALLDVGGTFAVQGNTTLGDASGDGVTSNAAAWTFANDTTVALTGGVNGINFDSDTLSIDATNNRVGIGTATPANRLDVEGAVAVGTTYSGSLAAPTNGMLVEGEIAVATGSGFSLLTGRQIHVNSDTANSVITASSFTSTAATRPTLDMIRGRGTLAASTAVLSGDTLGTVNFQGVYGAGVANRNDGAQIDAVATENWSAAATGAKLIFATGANGTALAPVVRMTIDHDGDVAISTLTASKGVFTDASKNLTSTGTLGTDQGGTGGTYPITLTSLYISGPLVAGEIGATLLPARAFTVTAERIYVSTAGSGGSTNAVFRVTDGVNNCDASFACNAVAGAKRPTLSGTCAFSASATLTFSINSIGDCATPPYILGSLDIEGNWP